METNEKKTKETNQEKKPVNETQTAWLNPPVTSESRGSKTIESHRRMQKMEPPSTNYKLGKNDPQPPFSPTKTKIEKKN